jgi:uncharacterized secreted protein with C-terminal beta-propeller domain
MLVDDSFDLHQNGPQVALEVLSNDVFDGQYGGPRLITSVSYGSEGGRIAIAPDRRAVLYTPPADFFGTESFVYAVDGQFTARVDVNVAAPLAFDHFEIPPDGLVHELAVLANDPFWDGYEGPREISSVSVGSAGGTVTITPGGDAVSYTPPDGAFGKETFTYVVDDLYPAQVTVEIPKTLEGDQFELVQHAPPQTFHVLANDPFWPHYPGERRITHVTEAQLGTVEISSDGQSVVYTPTNGSGGDSFRYVVDGTYEATVSVRIYRPVRDDSFEVDRNSTGFFYNVTDNDTYRDVHNVLHDVIDRVTSVTQPESGGTVEVSSDERGIVYTPPSDFSGGDTFTYVADGVHEATVHVNVTRPVRDDYISGSVYQDTPNAVLNVLANDFVGNGYTGPRLISDVGPTDNGGVITIRGDSKAILYTPAPYYTGYDHFTYRVDGDLEANVTVYVRPLAQSDYFQFAPDPAHGPYTLGVLANDYFGFGYPGPARITSASVTSGSGQVTVENGTILTFQPGSAGSHILQYTVDGEYEANVSIWFPNFLGADQFVVDQNASSQQLDVMTNDFLPSSPYARFKSQDYPGPRLITSASQSQHGGVVTITDDGRSVNYQPPSDYHGNNSFTYTVDGFMTATTTVEVIRRVRDDQFRVDVVDGQTELPVLVNDLLGADYLGPGQITAVTGTAAGGLATISADGRSILYSPPTGFVGTDTFTYTVDGALKAQVNVVVDAPAAEQFPTFASTEEFTQFLIDDALVRYQYLFGSPAWDFTDVPTEATPDGPTSDRGHSETNVQVAGVDEGDIIEFDSDYLYVLRDDEVVIVDAWPADQLSIASRIDIDGRTIAEYLHGDHLTVISETGGYYDPPWLDDGRLGPTDIWPQPPTFEPFTTIVTVLDVSDRAAPAVVQKTTMEGQYVDSRGVADYVYVLVSNGEAVAPLPQIIDEDNDPTTVNRYETQDEYLARVLDNPGEFVGAALPNYSSFGSDGELVRTGLLNMPEDIYRPIVPDADNLISVVSFHIEGNEPGLADTSALYGTGASNIYASLDNFYVLDTDYSAEDGAVTRITKFDWEPATGGIEFAATTTAPGTILNQFSADENGSYLRIATTVTNSSSGNWSGRAENTLFVLQEDDGVFEFVGGLKNLALDESMQSVRFLGDRAFVSTFRSVDPLFAIDLADPTRPESVGHVTLPGYTSYMHLVDENHLLTVGRNTPVGFSGPTQVALFDISNLAQPLRVAEYTFARFSTSEAEIDHHAFGYYAVHGLLGMPVSRTYYVRIDSDGDGYRETSQAVTEYELAVFTVDVSATEADQRLALAGEISHDSLVRRSGYIGDKLYSVANDSVIVVDVSAPNDVIAELVVATSDDDPEPVLGDGIDVPFTSGESPAAITSQAVEDPQIATAIDRARRDIAGRLGGADGAPLFITAEATPDAPGGGYCLVFRVGGDQYLYRASAAGLIALVQSDFNFAGGDSAWHAVDFVVTPPPTTLAGDFNLDGRVDEADSTIWRASFGDVSLTAFHAADGNHNGIVDTADYVVWRRNLGKVAADYGGDGIVNASDYTTWRENFGATADSGMVADGNDNGVVDAADYVFWRSRTSGTTGGLVAESPGRLPANAMLSTHPETFSSEPSSALVAVTADAVLAGRDTIFVPSRWFDSPLPATHSRAENLRAATSVDTAPIIDPLLLLAQVHVRNRDAGSNLSAGESDVGQPSNETGADEVAMALDAALAALCSDSLESR